MRSHPELDPVDCPAPDPFLAVQVDRSGLDLGQPLPIPTLLSVYRRVLDGEYLQLHLHFRHTMSFGDHVPIYHHDELTDRQTPDARPVTFPQTLDAADPVVV